MDIIDNVILLLITFFGSYYVSEKLFFSPIRNLSFIPRMQVNLRILVLLATIGLIAYSLFYPVEIGHLAVEPFSPEITLVIGMATIWFVLETILGLLQPFVKPRQKDQNNGI